MTGVRPEELDGPEPPPEFEYLIEWFVELNSARGAGGFGPAPITYADIEAWARLMRRDPTPFEVECLRALDEAYFRAQQEGGK